jgi:acetyltransferase-like isoleucine patch superfamily enzyme
MSAAPGARGRHAAGEFGLGERAAGALRRRVGLLATRLRHPRVAFGARCDVRRGGSFLVARGATATFGPGCVLDRGITVESRGTLAVGRGTVFGHHCTVAADEEVIIGERCLLAELVSVRDHDHAFDDAEVAVVDQGRVTAPVRIGDDVWIGAKATVLRGVTIGPGSVIGANAVVTRDVPPGSIAVGVPARVVGRRGEVASA